MAELVSAIVTTCDRAPLVERAVQSVLGQTYGALECVVVDDASSDETPAVLGRFATDPRVRIIRHATRQGLSVARNTGIGAARGAYVAFLDDDDVWLPTKLEKQVGVLEASPAEVALVYCWLELRAGTRVVARRCPTLAGRVFEHLLVHQPLGNGSTMLVRKDVAAALGGFDVGLPRGIDGDFVRRLALAHEIVYLPEVLTHVHVAHGFSRITADDRRGAAAALIGEHAKLEKFARELERYPRQRAAIYGTIGFHHSQLGEWAAAGRWFARALGTQPLAFSTWRPLLRAGKALTRRRRAGAQLLRGASDALGPGR